MAAMGKKVVWRDNSEFKGKANAELVQKEIDLVASLNANGKCVNKELVDFAQNHPLSESHKCFEWNDTKAAEAHRLYQAERIKNSTRTIYVPVEQVTESMESVEIPVEIKQEVKTVTNHALTDLPGDGHKNIELILNSQLEKEALKRRMYESLRTFVANFETRYIMVPEATQYIQELKNIVSKLP